MTKPQGPGFVLPPVESQSHQPPYNPQYPPQPGYPPQQAPGYPPQQPMYPGYSPQTGQHNGQPSPFQHQPFPAPIQNQAASHPPSDWHANSDYRNILSGTHSFFVKQKVELLEALVGFETENKYLVKDQAGNKVFYVGEESGCFTRQFCGPYRPFELALKDAQGLDVLRIERESCQACNIFCGAFCPDYVSVRTARGESLGAVVQEFSIFYPRFKLKDATGKTRLKIEGPLCPMQFGKCAGNVVFKVTDKIGAPMGTISKEWGGIVRELFTDADCFGITFPPNLDPAMKAVCLGALFLIEFRYFEQSS